MISKQSPIFLFALLVVAFLVSNLHSVNASSTQLPKLGVSGPYFTAGGQKIYFQGVNVFQCWYSWSADRQNIELQKIKDAGFNLIRVLVYGDFANNQGTINPTRASKLKDFIADANQHGLYVMVSPQEFWGGEWSWLRDHYGFASSQYQNGIVQYFRAIARYLTDNGLASTTFLSVWWESDYCGWKTSTSSLIAEKTLFRKITKLKYDAIKSVNPNIIVNAMSGNYWKDSVTFPGKNPADYIRPDWVADIVDVIDIHDYQPDATAIKRCFTNLKSYGKPLIWGEVGCTFYNDMFPTKGDVWWKQLKPKLEAIRLGEGGSGYAYWNWNDYKRDAPFGLVDANFYPRQPAFSIMSSYIITINHLH